MTLKPLADDFAIVSALSQRPPGAVARDEHLLELNAELVKRVKVYPAHVTSGTMSQTDCDHHLAIWRALIDDYHTHEVRAAARRGAGHPATPAYRWTWDARVRELRRELAMRRAAYPKWIASPTNPLTAAEAARKLERLDAIHARYWLDLFAFGPGDLPADHDMPRIAFTADREYRRQAEAWRIVDEKGYGAHVLLRAAWITRAWRAIADLARHDDAGGHWTSFLEAPDDCRALLSEVRRAIAQLLDAPIATIAGTPRERELAQLLPVERWLARFTPPVRVPAKPVPLRKTA